MDGPAFRTYDWMGDTAPSPGSQGASRTASLLQFAGEAIDFLKFQRKLVFHDIEHTNITSSAPIGLIACAMDALAMANVTNNTQTGLNNSSFVLRFCERIFGFSPESDARFSRHSASQTVKALPSS